MQKFGHALVYKFPSNRWAFDLYGLAFVTSVAFPKSMAHMLDFAKEIRCEREHHLYCLRARGIERIDPFNQSYLVISVLSRRLYHDMIYLLDTFQQILSESINFLWAHRPVVKNEIPSRSAGWWHHTHFEMKHACCFDRSSSYHRDRSALRLMC